MMLVTAVVIGATALFARAEFGARAGAPEARAPFAFWPLLLAVWGALNTVFLAARSLHPLRRARAADLRRRAARVPRRARRDAAGRAALSALRARSARGSTSLGIPLLYGDLRHARHLAARRARAPGPGDAHGRRADDGGAAREDRALPAAPVAAARARRRARSGEHGALGARGQGLVLRARAPLVRRRARERARARSCSPRSAPRRSSSATSSRCGRRASSCSSPIRPSRRSAISSSCSRSRSARARPRRTARRRSTAACMQVISHAIAKAAMFMSAGLIYAALGHDRIADLRGRRPRAADERLRVRARRHRARRPAALRRLPREMAAALGGGRDRAVVVGGGDADRRPAHRVLRRAGGDARDDRARYAARAEGRSAARTRGGRARARGGARCCSASSRSCRSICSRSAVLIRSRSGGDDDATCSAPPSRCRSRCSRPASCAACASACSRGSWSHRCPALAAAILAVDASPLVIGTGPVRLTFALDLAGRRCFSASPRCCGAPRARTPRVTSAARPKPAASRCAG